MSVLKVILLTTLLYAAVHRAGFSQCNPADSAALVEFYYSTGGPNWICDSNWLITPVKKWFGIYMSQPDSLYVAGIFLPNNNLNGVIPPAMCNLGYILQLYISSNNLSGTIPYCMGNIPNLRDVELALNQFTGPFPPMGKTGGPPAVLIAIQYNEFSGPFPDSVMMNPELSRIQLEFNKFNEIHYFPGTNLLTNQSNVDNNCFTFQHLIPFIQNLGPFYSYYPQDSILELLDTLVQIGSTLVLDSWIDTCSQNKYAWRKNGAWLNWNSPDSYWVLNNIQHSDTGLYTCQVTNLQCLGLALHRRMIRVRVADTLTGLQETRPEQDAIHIRWFQQQLPPLLKLSFNFPRYQRIHASLINTEGQQVRLFYHGDIRQRELAYTLDNLQAGLYLVRIMTPEGTVSKKIVVQ